MSNVSIGIFETWLLQAHGNPPCFMHFFFTSILNTLARISKVMHYTPLMINMLITKRKMNN
jgi:hypothetical protein